jgi:anthranilate phosphoribosyltransferase
MQADAKKLLLRAVTSGEALSREVAREAFGAILDGDMGDIETAALLTAMTMRGASPNEIAGAAEAMRARMIAVAAPDNAIDVCGTGGDGRNTLNVSTAVAFVLAGCDVPVAKHGNRAITSRAGSADVLRELGISGDFSPGLLSAVLDAVGIVFLCAPNHHPGLRGLADLRARLGFRTLFNVLGPLCNPARVKRQVIGVYDPLLCVPLAKAAGLLGAEHVWVVHGSGTDELSLAGVNHVAEYAHGAWREFSVGAADAGLAPAPLEAIAGGDAAFNASALRRCLEGELGPYRDTVLLNAAAALMVAGRVKNPREGCQLASSSIDHGKAMAALNALREACLACAEERGTV